MLEMRVGMSLIVDPRPGAQVVSLIKLKCESGDSVQLMQTCIGLLTGRNVDAVLPPRKQRDCD